MEKRWGKEEVLKRLCPDCHELIIQETYYEEKSEKRELTLSKEEKDYVCKECCNLKECVEECPLKEDDSDYYLDSDDLEYLCSHCKNIGKECNSCCPIRKEQSKQ